MRHEPEFAINPKGQLAILIGELDFEVSHYVLMGRRLDLVGDTGHLEMDVPKDFAQRLKRERRLLLVQCKPFTILKEQVVKARGSRHAGS
jgi:hypothetical protein